VSRSLIITARVPQSKLCFRSPNKTVATRLSATALSLVGSKEGGNPINDCPIETRKRAFTSVESYLNSIPCTMGRPASFATRGMQFQHYIQLECPKGRDLDAKMIVLAPNTLFSPVFPKPDQPCFDLLRHDPDDTPESFKNLKPKFFTSAEFSTFVAERARSFCATTSYDPGLYTKNVDGCIAVINDLAGPNNDAKIFPGSSQLVVSEKYKQAFDSYGKATCF
jgi:hypothetical protein